MRLPWNKSKEVQLDLLDAEPGTTAPHQPAKVALRAVVSKPDSGAIAPASVKLGGNDGRPMVLAVSMLYEDASNPRTEFAEDSLTELAEDIQQRGVLQPLVVHPADGDGRHRIHFGAQRLRAAIRAGLLEVPVVVRDLPADRYAQVAENQKRQGLTPLELARFIRAQVDAGESQTTIARQLGMNLTTVSHHLSLLDLPLKLDDALKAGRCTSPRTLHELSRLHDRHPARVEELLDGSVPVTRDAVRTLRSRVDAISTGGPARLIGQAMSACDRLEKLLAGIDLQGAACDRSGLKALQTKLTALSRWPDGGSDGQTL